MPSSTFSLFIRHRFYKCTCSIESGDSAGYFSNSHLIAITVAATHCVGQCGQRCITHVQYVLKIVHRYLCGDFFNWTFWEKSRSVQNYY